MNEVIRQLYDRKSVRAYTDREISREEKDAILPRNPDAGILLKQQSEYLYQNTLYEMNYLVFSQIRCCL